jgi:molybdopterin-guanine dinucleotide biosynthesis protein B
MGQAIRVISVVGKKDAGKTTLVVALARQLVKQGRRVSTIKHGSHPARMDTPGTDTYRHYEEGLASQVLMEFPGGRVFFERAVQPLGPTELVRRFISADIVLIEGFTREPLPKIEVHRRAKHAAPLYQPGMAGSEHWVAMLTDDPELQLPIPVFRFDDTHWLVFLANLAWAKAAEIVS